MGNQDSAPSTDPPPGQADGDGECEIDDEAGLGASAAGHEGSPV